MVKYSLEHLTQNDSQNVIGPIQDDEALFLFSIVKGMRLKTVFEIGGLEGYSAINFLHAVGNDGAVYTCDINPIKKLAENHFCIQKNALDIQPADLNNNFIELIFFDCHDYHIQMKLFDRLRRCGLINRHTILALHDTNTHPYQVAPWAYPISDGWVHNQAEREMVNTFVRMGYHAFSLHTRPEKHSKDFPFRHGLTILSLFQPLKTSKYQTLKSNIKNSLKNKKFVRKLYEKYNALH